MAARDPMSYVDPIGKIQAYVAKNGIRIREFFADFDKLRTGAVTREQFQRCLHLVGVGALITPEGYEEVYQNFPGPKDPKNVAYPAFCKRIEEGAATASLGQTAPTAGPLARRPRPSTLTPEEWDLFEKQQTLFVQEAMSRAYVLKEPFQDFDRRRSGRVTAPQFQRCFPFRVDQATIEVFVKRYKSDDGAEVHYLAWVGDIEDAIAAKKAPRKPATPRQRGNLVAAKAPEDIDTVLVVIRSKIFKDRVRVKDFFADADKLRKGVIPNAKFRGGLDMAGFRLSEPQLIVLEEAFASPTGPNTVNYVNFCNQVESVLGEAGLEKDPVRRTNQFKPNARHPLKADLKPWDEAAEQEVNTLLDKARSIINAKRMHLKPHFQDFDKIRKERVSRTQFASVMDKMQLRLTVPELEQLTNRFEDERGDIDYTRFCLAVDPNP